MANRRIAQAALAAGALLAASFSAFGQGGDSLQAEMALVNKFTGFAGSQQNAIALVDGLRNGSLVTLQPFGPGCPAVPPPPPVVPPTPTALPPAPPGFPPPPGGLPKAPGAFAPPPPPPAPPAPLPMLPASFTPPTGNMGYGNVSIAIDLAQQQLANAGFKQPTPLQMRSSLMGGPVSTCTGAPTLLEGILVLRAGKEGWGRIASRLGLSVNE